MSTRKLPEDERLFRLAQAKRRLDFAAGVEPARRLTTREREEAQRQYALEQKGAYQHLAGIELRKRRWHFVDKEQERKFAAVFPPTEVFTMKAVLDHIRLVFLTGGRLKTNSQLLIDRVASLLTERDTWITDELTRLYKSEPPESPKASKHRKLLAAHQLQTYFECYAGMTPGNAEQEAAAAIGRDVGALRKRRERYRKRKLPR